MTEPQYCKTTLICAIEEYQLGILTAKGLLYYYLRIRLKHGWTLKETQKEICEQLGISRTAFYTALSKLKADGLINWSAPADTKFSISLNSFSSNESAIADGESAIADGESAIADGESAIADGESAIADRPSFIATGEKSQTKQSKGFKKPSYSSSSSSSDSISNSSSDSLSRKTEREQWEFFQKTLSGEELESFMNFGVHTAKSFKESLTTTAIRLPEAWVKKNHQELYKQFLVALKEKYGTSDFQLILDGQYSENPPPVENQPIPSDIEYRSIANLKRAYGSDWKNAAAHFGINTNEIS